MWAARGLLLGLMLVLAACGRGPERSSDPALARGNTLVMAVEAAADVLPDVKDLDFLVFDRFARRNERGELEGLLAQSWEVSDDYWEWTIHLRDDVRWHDGVPVTAHDVRFAFDLLDNADRGYPGFETDVLDDLTIRVRPPSAIQFIDDIFCYPRHLLERLDPEGFWSWEFWLQPVGNGPYRFVRYVPDTLMEFEINRDYHGPKPAIERVILKFVGQAGLAELLAGKVDVVEGDLAQIPLIERDPRLLVHRQLTHAARAIYWKTDHVLFRDPRVRRALTLAIDRRELARVLYLPPDTPITDGPLTRRQLYGADLPEPLPYDPKEADRLLEQAGWTDEDGDGLRERDGLPFRFTATFRRGNGVPQLGVYVQEYLQRLGIRMEIEVLEESLSWERLYNGDFEALFTIQQPGVEAHIRDFGRDNNIGYHNPAAFEIIDRMAATARPDDQDRRHVELAALFREDQPVTRLLPWDWTTFAHRRVRGLASPVGSRVDSGGTYIDEMWIEGAARGGHGGP